MDIDQSLLAAAIKLAQQPRRDTDKIKRTGVVASRPWWDHAAEHLGGSKKKGGSFHSIENRINMVLDIPLSEARMRACCHILAKPEP